MEHDITYMYIHKEKSLQKSVVRGEGVVQEGLANTLFGYLVLYQQPQGNCRTVQSVLYLLWLQRHDLHVAVTNSRTFKVNGELQNYGCSTLLLGRTPHIPSYLTTSLTNKKLAFKSDPIGSTNLNKLPTHSMST